MRSELERALRLVAGASGDADDWWIIGSAAMVLCGLEDVVPEDVDFLGSKDTVLRLIDRLGAPPDRLPVAEPVTASRFRSDPYQRISGDHADIEVMGDLEVMSGAAWRRLRPLTRRRIDGFGGALFVPELHEQAQIMRLFGRPKDFVKALRIDTYLAEAS